MFVHQNVMWIWSSLHQPQPGLAPLDSPPRGHPGQFAPWNSAETQKETIFFFQPPHFSGAKIWVLETLPQWRGYLEGTKVPFLRSSLPFTVFHWNPSANLQEIPLDVTVIELNSWDRFRMVQKSIPWVVPPPSNCGKWRFIGIPY